MKMTTSTHKIWNAWQGGPDDTLCFVMFSACDYFDTYINFGRDARNKHLDLQATVPSFVGSCEHGEYVLNSSGPRKGSECYFVLILSLNPRQRCSLFDKSLCFVPFGPWNCPYDVFSLGVVLSYLQWFMGARSSWDTRFQMQYSSEHKTRYQMQ